MKILILSLIFTLNTKIVFGQNVINWQTDGNGIFAYGCDFVSNQNVLTNVSTLLQQCGSQCKSTPSCTHYSWTSDSGGNCKLKSGTINKQDAFSNGKTDMICGIITNSADSTTTDGPPKCDEGWLERPFSSYCYRLNTELVTYESASIYCKAVSGEIVSITSVDEQLFIQTVINSNFWLGANRESANKGWQWKDGSPFIFTNWDQGEYITGSNQYCAIISSSLNGQWKTVKCTELKFNSLCKKVSTYATLVPPTTVYPINPSLNYGCEQGWSQNYKTNYCYKYFGTQNDLVSFNKAKDTCKQDYNSDLVEILSENENQFVVSLLDSKKTHNISNKDVPKLTCPGGWQLESSSNKCFKSIEIDTKDWNSAQNFCKNQGGYLATVKSFNDNSVLTQIANKSLGDIWIGLKRSKNTNSWVLSDKTDQFYSNWDTNFPTNSNLNDRCAVLRVNGNNKWYDIDCVQATQSLHFICQQDPAIQDTCTQYFSSTFGTNGVCINKGQCPNSQFVTGLCGDYNEPDVECCFDSQKDKQGIWMGMYDELSGFNQISFKLLSGMQPTYTNWAPSEPLTEGTCVAMHKKDASTFLNPSFSVGQWMVNKCSFRNNFICKKPVTQGQALPTTISTPGCPQGFNGYQTRCFKTVLNELTWDEAESNCYQMNSNLVSIMDRFEQSWLTQSQSNSGLKWIGLSDKTTLGTYTWSNSDKVDFTNWDRNKPDQSEGRCIAMNSAGFWTNYNCSSKFQSTCMAYNYLYTTPTTPSTPPPPKCATGWTEQDSNCYKLFGPKNSSEMLNWYDAEAFCQNIDGHLASFRSLSALTNVLSKQNVYSFPDYTFWFGLTKLEQNQGYQYSDGSSVTFTNWDYTEPSNTNGRENCVDLKNTGKWRDFYCYVNKGWICSIPRGIEPNSTDFMPSKFDIIECDNNTNYKWTLYKNKCYYVSTGVNNEKLSWQKSREFCKNINGDLVSIHTEKELQYITTISSQKLDRWHIGLSQFTPNSGFVWSDGSPVNFVNWAPGEPNNANGGEKCAEMISSNSFWNDGKCGAEQGFVCEKSNRTTFIQSEDVLPLSFTGDNDGNLCPNGYSTFGIQTKNNKGEQKPCSFPFKYNGQYYYECVNFENRNPWCATTSDYDTDKEWGFCVDIKCFKVVTTKLSYGQSRIQCEKDGASLASIHNEIEHAYVTALLRKSMNMDYYIGLWSPGGHTGNTFFYEDNSELTFTKWAPNKPGNNFYNERCVVMSGDSNKAGLWLNVDGNRAYGFICSQYSNGVKFVTSCQTSNRSIVLSCPNSETIMIIKADFGREAYSMTCDDDYFYGDCTSSTQTTEKVRSLCQSSQSCNLTASNATFTDNCPSIVKQLKVWYQCVKTPIITTGGNSNGASCVFPFTYKNVLRHQCTYEQHPDYVNKKWCCTNSNCDNDFKWGICPESKSPLDTSNCSKPGYTSIDLAKNCYKVFDTDLKTWKDAKQFCEQTEGGKLVSIIDGFEQSYIRLLSYTSFSMSNPWIGLIRNNSENYFWSDDWPLEYTNWETGLEIDSLPESCAYFNSSTGTWSSTGCYDKKSYICKISQEIPPALTTLAPGRCPNGTNWSAFGPSCYSFELQESYLNAKYICEQKGAYVSSIHSQEELDFLNSLTGSTSIWIGLQKNLLTSKYEWNDGSNLGFSKFPTTPVQVQGTNCVYMYSNTWYDYDCLSRLRFVCKRPKIFDSTTSITTTTTTTTATTTTLTTTRPTTTTTTATRITGNIILSSSTSKQSSSSSKKATTQIIVTKIPDNTLSNGALYGIIGGVILGVLTAIVITLVVLRKKGIIKKDLPFLKFNNNNSDLNEAIYSKHSDSIVLNNPNYN